MDPILRDDSDFNLTKFHMSAMLSLVVINYEVRSWGGLQWQYVHTKFRENLPVRTKLEGWVGEGDPYKDTQTAWSYNSTFFPYDRKVV
jgi:hypothetical protein